MSETARDQLERIALIPSIPERLSALAAMCEGLIAEKETAQVELEDLQEVGWLHPDGTFRKTVPCPLGWFNRPIKLFAEPSLYLPQPPTDTKP